MKAGSKAIRILERGLLLLGLLLLVLSAFAHIHRFVMFRAEMAKFETRQLESPKGSISAIEAIRGTNGSADLHQARGTEYSTLGNQQTKLNQADLARPL